MKRFSTLLLSVALAVGTTVSAVAQTADEIVQKHLSAIGGADAWRNVKTMKMVGAVKAPGVDMPITMTLEHEKAMRMDMTIGGMENYLIVTPTEGWSYFPVGGQTKPEAMTPDQLKAMAEQLDVQGEFLDYAKKGHTVELQGKEDIEGTECYKIRLKRKDGTEEISYIDPATYYIVRSVTKATADGQEQESTQSFSNYQKVDGGIVLPMSIESEQGPLTLTSVEVNKPIDASVFKPKS